MLEAENYDNYPKSQATFLSKAARS